MLLFLMSMNLDLARCLSQIKKIWFVLLGSLPLKQSKGFKARGGIKSDSVTRKNREEATFKKH